MTTRHTISHADKLYRGNARYAAYTPDGRRGIEVDVLKFVNLGAPDTADVDGILDGVTVSTDTVQAYTAGDMATATLDVARNIQIVSTDGTQADNVVTVTGTDVYGETLVETITANGQTTVQGNKAFKTLTSISAAAGTEETTLDVGWGTKLGLPVFLEDSSYLMAFRMDGANNTVTIAVASDTTATATTGDVRGTLTPGTAPNNVRKYTALVYIANTDVKSNVFGQDQYGG